MAEKDRLHNEEMAEKDLVISGKDRELAEMDRTHKEQNRIVFRFSQLITEGKSYNEAIDILSKDWDRKYVCDLLKDLE